MSESDVKLVKVDNWGIYFLQRLKHFFNRTDYCDLTLQFQDNAQLKVHRLVLSACTEYFELLERTCEMYEDCLVMPDDLQADVVVPIVNFMYTGQLEFKMDLLDRLYQTSQIMNMPVLTKLLNAHRNQAVLTPVKPAIQQRLSVDQNSIKRSYSKPRDVNVKSKQVPVASSSNTSSKRSFTKAFGNTSTIKEIKKPTITNKVDTATNNGVASQYISVVNKQVSPNVTRKSFNKDPRPTRYELPEELDTDNIFDSSFTNISYTSQPLMIHPDTSKQFISNPKIYSEASGSRKMGSSTLNIIECKKVSRSENIFEDDSTDILNDSDMFPNNDTPSKSSNQLFDQIIDQNEGPKVTIETKDSKQSSNIDHAKIISEVLKKYPHLVKSNKNIKLKILNTPTNPSKPKSKKARQSPPPYQENVTSKTELPDFTYESDVLDSKEAARLIAMGAENIKGPWICLICGTPGRALHFTSYYKFRCHLVEIHNEKPLANMCEYCGLKSTKRKYLLHHLFTKHGVEPPPSHQFPKCNICSYVALTETFLAKHKLSHSENRNFRCNVCATGYNSSGALLAHIQKTGHKYSADRKTNLLCIYCMKVFLREGNLYWHLKTYHKAAAKCDGIIDDSDDEQTKDAEIVKYEPQVFKTEYEEPETQYQIRPDGNIELVPKKPRNIEVPVIMKQKILNSGFGDEGKPIQKPVQNVAEVQDEYNEEIVMIDNNEYIMRDNQLIPNKKGNPESEYILSDLIRNENEQALTPSTSVQYTNVSNTISEENLQQKLIIKKAGTLNQPIQIVVSNEEEYKALMNSNHSIIFDDGDSNKTLTVLSTPHNATLDTTALELDNTQSNEMMIIQDNYPLNVSEALPADNSNIVVVYSHAVDEQNKQSYQLITSQDIGAQFVQSSAVITQNFETITTSTPVMSEHVIATNVGGAWQSADENIERPAGLQEIQEMTIVEPTTIVSSEVAAEPAAVDVNDLPEISLTAVKPPEESLPDNDSEENLIQPNDITITTENTMTIAESTHGSVEHVPETPMDVDVSTEAIIDNTIITGESVQKEVPEETLQHDVINTNTEEEGVEEGEEQLIDQSAIVEQETNQAAIVEQETEHTEDQALEINNENKTSDNAEVEDEEREDKTTEDEVVGQVEPENDGKETLAKEPSEQIQTLTSEWSEDEYDTEEQGQVDELQEENVVNNSEENENALVPQEIENIEQEMGKPKREEIPETNKEAEAEEQEAAEPPIAGPIVTEPPIAAAPEKITSLLNDWDENDSQEENDSVNGSEDNVSAQVAASETDNNGIKEVVAEDDKSEPKKADKIQSLVSDWDDDDDEVKS